MRIAIIAYDFPPLNSGGSQRPYLLANYLSEQSIDVVVFTLDESFYPSGDLNFKLDESFSKKVKIVRSDLRKESFIDPLFNYYYFNIVDHTGSRWGKSLVEKFQAEQTNNPFDYVLVTCPPFSLAPLGVSISKAYDVPLVLDMRDAWSQWVTAPYASCFHYRATVNLERKCFSHARYITYTSEQQKLDWLQIHPQLEVSKFIYMPNGFTSYRESIETRKDGFIRIFYAGSFYYNPESDRLIHTPWYRKRPYQYFQYVPRVEHWKYRTPFYFFRILNQFITQYPELGMKIQVRFAGKKPEWFDGMVKEFDLEQHVIHLGFLDKQKIEEEMIKSDYFLLTSSKVENGRDYSVAGKMFEYFSFRKPIVGIVTEGEQKEILEKSGISVVLNPDEMNSSVDKLINFLHETKLETNSRFIEQFKVPNNFSMLVSSIK